MTEQTSKHLTLITGMLIGIAIGFACAKLIYQCKEISPLNTHTENVFIRVVEDTLR